MPTTQKKFISHFFSKLFIILVFLFLLGTYIKTLALGSPYQPGAILNPACIPEETNCFVQIIPDQTGHSGKYLTTDGSVTSWATVSGGSLIGSTSTNDTEVWLGLGAGASSGASDRTTFIGENAGSAASAAIHSTFIGMATGASATNAYYSQFIGRQAGASATNASQSVFIGVLAGYAATNAANSIFIGSSAGSSDTVNNPQLGSSASILIGNSTSTGGFTNSIAIGTSATNTATNQLLIASDYTQLNMRGVNYTMPSAQGGVNTTLLNNGSGALTWGSLLVPISTITAATGVNTINSGAFQQEWQWNTLAAGTGLKLSSNSTLASSVSQRVFEIALSGANVNGSQTTYSSYISNTHTGSGAVNVAGYFTATGGISNYAGIFANGNVGIGTTTPNELLSLGTAGTKPGVLSLAGGTSGKIIIQTATAAGTWTLTLPTSEGSTGYLLSTDGTGITSWVAPLIGVTSGQTWLGQNAGASGGSTSQTVFVGVQSGSGASNSDGSNFIGYQSGNGATDSSNANFFGYQSGNGASTSQYSNFIGREAGSGASSSNNSNFMGYQAGLNATSTTYSNFIGNTAGSTTSSTAYSNFIGSEAGSGTTGVVYSNFIGSQAGSGSNADYSVFIGNTAGQSAGGASNSVFLGNAAGISAATATNSIFIGQNAGASDASDNTGDVDDFSILIGKSTSTDGFENSIAIGGSAVNTASNQFMIGSTTRSIEEMVITGTAQTCTIRPDTAGINCTSDERLKTNIVDLENTLDLLKSVRTVNYNWSNNPTSNPQIGFLAQNLKQYFPTLVSTSSNGYLQVNYGGMTPILTRAVQELNIKIEGLSSLDTTIPNSLGSLIKSFLGSIGNQIGDLYASVIHSDRVQTKTLCVGSTCVTEDQFLKMVQQSGGQNSGGGDIIQPPTDICPNIDGAQSTLPEGYHLDEAYNCVIDTTPPTDQTPTPDPNPDSSDGGDSPTPAPDEAPAP